MCYRIANGKNVVFWNPQWGHFFFFNLFLSFFFFFLSLRDRSLPAPLQFFVSLLSLRLHFRTNYRSKKFVTHNPSFVRALSYIKPLITCIYITLIFCLCYQDDFPLDYCLPNNCSQVIPPRGYSNFQLKKGFEISSLNWIKYSQKRRVLITVTKKKAFDYWMSKMHVSD